MKKVKISKDTAEEMIDSGIDSLKKLALDTYPELGEPRLPKSWKDAIPESGYYVNNLSQIKFLPKGVILKGPNKNILPTKKLAKAILTLCQLLHLRDVYRQGWEPSSVSANSVIYNAIRTNYNAVRTDRGIFTFQDKETADKFAENFSDLLDNIKPLYE